ncbi:hypothetical protein GB931_17985 [Modestobacter sp. I12A-02628]|uniref:receptor protein-tyrosine kinase n=1 Tax=Goekera deserti TaxID=2497753 RepID=A0A7K3W7Z7_9ACTN|nr:glycine-rich protein [Goekera deserti]MPQ99772.1 hypothetical protein [Goekera deserti]NDI49531.1 hypothetical protein [Goekera deserti]NEL52595.1 hypothetical protein [Goekera deserti]
MLGALVAPALAVDTSRPGVTVWSPSDGDSVYTVPAGVCSIAVSLIGGGGGSVPGKSHLAGAGGYLEFRMTVVAGQEFLVQAGGQGALQAGGHSGASPSGGGSVLGYGGGGASVLREGSTAQAPVLAVAGGGGGAGAGFQAVQGGDAGPTGAGGQDDTPGGGGGGGTAAAGGAGGVSTFETSTDGQPGAASLGGDAPDVAGGGGGGWFGGGSGAWAMGGSTHGGGGGAGSNHLVTDSRISQPFNRTMFPRENAQRPGRVLVSELPCSTPTLSAPTGPPTSQVPVDPAPDTVPPAVPTTTSAPTTTAAPTPTSTTASTTAPAPTAPVSPPAGPEGPAPVVPPVPPATPLTLTTDRGVITDIDPGQALTVMGTGFRPFSAATIVIYSTPVVLGTVTTDADGNFRTTVTVPTSLEAGAHSLVASGTAPDGTSRFLRMDVVMDGPAHASPPAPSGGPALAYTGAATVVPALIGVGLLAGGGGLLVAARRRAG